MLIRWLVALAMCCASLSFAQGIESIMAPGKLIQGHAKLEDDCKQCHVKFDRKAQDGLCMACHKDVGADVRNKGGFHGRIADPTCRSCHTDHKGRDAHVVDLDKKKFDHTKTDFQLRGKHDRVECDKCHVAGKKYREAALECNVCHKKDDIHKGSLGLKCADCHTEVNWKDAKFDHDSTKFALTGKHTDTKCVDCHKNNIYKETSKNCYACHRKVDDQKGHKGQFGEKCDTCHSTKEWRSNSFNHDTDTKYVLRGKHRSVTCKDCHTGNLYRDKLVQECLACHKKDDKHKETLGKECGSCHTERSWKEPSKFDHETTTFPLLGKHAKVECKECHKSAMFKEAPKDCYACHKKDDKHKDTLGKDCASCHVERDWKLTEGRFSHERTRFPLRNAHAPKLLKCDACHKDLHSYRNTAMDCFSCHKKDDKHDGQAGAQCETCHSDKSWKVTRFDHALSRFPLTGRHVAVACKSCHETSRYKDAPRDCFSCHKKEDKHKQRLGMRCETCHNTRAWSVWSFDHDTKTKYKLEGGHRKVACESCHKQAAAPGKEIAPVSSTCIACHSGDDVHEGQFGGRCEQCHISDSWKKLKARVGAVSVPSGTCAVSDKALQSPQRRFYA
jgi:Cytochrome c7 and related cytochrome c